MNRITPIFVSCLFFGCIFLPFLLFLTTPDKEISHFEKRSLAQKPELSSDLQSLSRYPEEFENYYKEQFGLRDKLVALYNLFYIKILRESPESTVILGRDEWLFYTPDRASFLDYSDLAQTKPHLLYSWVHTLEDRQEWLSGLGVHYLMVVAPDKLMVYPEKLPGRLQGKADDSLMDRFMASLDDSDVSSNVLFLKHELVASKEKHQTYHRTDTHWTPDGAFVAYTAIMERIKNWFPESTPLVESSLVRTPQTYAGDLSIVLHLSEIFTEDVFSVEVASSCSQPQSRKLSEFIHPIKDFRGPLYLPVENGCRGKSLTALVIHDSFGLYLRSYFSESFGRVIYSNYASLNHLKVLIKEVKPDVIIDQRVARNLSGLFRPDPEIEKDILTKHFDQSADVVLRIDANSGVDNFVNTHDVFVEQGPEGVQLFANSNDPFAEFYFETSSGAESFLVQIALTSPKETELQFFYTTSVEKDFSSYRMITRKIQEGRNDLLFRLPHPDTFGKVRFDPGAVLGKYILHSLIIKQEHKKINNLQVSR